MSFPSVKRIRHIIGLVCCCFFRQQNRRPPELKDLVERRDWGGVRDFLQNNSGIVSSDTLTKSIKYLLTHYNSEITQIYKDHLLLSWDETKKREGERIIIVNNKDNNHNTPPPLDIFQLLSSKRRQLSPTTSSSKDIDRDRCFKREISEEICCDCPMEVVYGLPLPIFELILNEHKQWYTSTTRTSSSDDQVDDKTSSVLERTTDGNQRRNMVEDLWGKLCDPGCFGNINLDSKCLKESVETQLLSLESADDLSQDIQTSLSQAWQRIILITMDRRDSEKIPLLHGAVMDGFPFPIIWLICKQHPEQLYHKDHLGRTPLHYACANPLMIGGILREGFELGMDVTTLIEIPPKFDKVGGWKDGQKWPEGDSCCPFLNIDFFLSQAPETINYIDNQSKLPLVLYLERIIDRARSCYNISDIERELNQAWRVVEATHQQGLNVQEAEAGLMPFMIPVAAAAAEASKSPPPDLFDKEKDAQLSLDLTYRLLRYDPTVLSRFDVASRNGAAMKTQSAEQQEEELSFYKSHQAILDCIQKLHEARCPR